MLEHSVSRTCAFTEDLIFTDMDLTLPCSFGEYDEIRYQLNETLSFINLESIKF